MRTVPANSKKKWGLLLAALLCLAALGGGVSYQLDRLHVTPILMYHHIDGRAQEWKLSVSPESFRRQMEYLKKHRFEVLDLREYVRRLKAGEKTGRKTVVLTFDDGYDNNLTNAMPVLKEMGFPATVFIQTDGAGRKGYMTDDEVRKLIQNGVSIGSHTVHHAFLPNVPTQTQRAEILDSKLILEKKFGVEVPMFSYPGGGFDASARQIAIESGYEGAVATHPGKDYPDKDPYALRRIRIARTSDNPIVFWAQLSGYYTYLEKARK